MLPERPTPLKAELYRRNEWDSPSAHWARYRDVAVWLCHLHGGSQRLIAFVFDLDRNEVRRILRRYHWFLGATQRRPGRKRSSPGGHGIRDILSLGKSTHSPQG